MVASHEKEVKCCMLCKVFDDKGTLENESRCPICNGLLKYFKGYLCPSCERLHSKKLIKCIGCAQLGVEFIGCADCMDHKGPDRHHIDCPNWRQTPS